MNKHYDYLVVGAGLYGAVFAHEAKKAGRSVLVIDKRPQKRPTHKPDLAQKDRPANRVGLLI